MALPALLLAAASLSLSVSPQTPRLSRLRSALATVLQQMGTTVRVGPEAESSCSGACVQVLVLVQDASALLVARRGLHSASSPVELGAGEPGFDQVHALALQVRDLAGRLPPWAPPQGGTRAPARSADAPAATAAPPAASPPAAAPPAVASAPPAPQPEEREQVRAVKIPPFAPLPAPAPLAEPSRDAPFGVGAGFIAVLTGESDFRSGGLLLTAHFPLWAALDARASVGLIPSRLRDGGTGRRSIHLLPATLVISTPLVTPRLRLGLGVELIDASVDFVTGGLDSATSLSAGPLAQIEYRLPVSSLFALHLGVGVAYQPFQQANEIGNNVAFGFPAFSVLGTLAAELSLRR